MFQLEGVSIVKGEKTILDIAALEIPTDKFTVILGHNGSGKSTLVDLLAGQLQPDRGMVKLESTCITSLGAKHLAQKIAYLPQYLPQASGLTVRELVKLGRYPWRGVFGRFNQEDDNIVDEAMRSTGVSQYEQDSAENLSGGERQRAWIAMLIAQHSPILILDEPTSALDIQHQYQILDLLTQLNQEQNRGVIVILHDLNLILRYAEHVIALKSGQVSIEGCTEEVLTEDTLSDLYQKPIKLVDHPIHKHKVAVVC
ncbi:ABC transporter ATP-binding protein [Vibrio sp. RC27]